MLGKTKTEEDLSRMCNERNFIFLKKEINDKIYVEYKCSKGHVSRSSYQTFRKGSGCRLCSYNIKKPSIDFIRKEFEKRGYFLKSDKYTNNTTKLHFKCDKGHSSTITWSSFYNKKAGCWKCVKTNIDEVKKEFEQRNWILLSNEYIDPYTKLNGICNKGHTVKISLANFRSGIGCTFCSGTNIKTIDEVRILFSQRGYSLIEKEYTNKRQKLHFICDKGHEDTISWKHFSRNDRDIGSGCSKCMYKNEQDCRQIIEKLTGLSFPKSKPKFLNGLEYDGYCKKGKMAFEYQGQQHYYYINHFHRNGISDLIDQMLRDRIKVKLSEKNNITLITIPYHVDKEKFIRHALGKAHSRGQ